MVNKSQLLVPEVMGAITTPNVHDNINDSSSSSILEQEQEINTLYNERDNNNNSPVVTDKDTSNISFETPKNEKTELELYNNSVQVSNYAIKSESVVVNENENKPESVDPT